MNYKRAKEIFGNENWTEIESALFYYRWFGEETLFDFAKEGIENNKKEFCNLIKKIKEKEE